MQRHQAAAARAETTVLEKEEARITSRKMPGSIDQHTRTDSATASSSDPVPGPKELSTLQAEFARRGYELYPLGEHELYVTRWNLGRVLADLDAARRFLVQIGGSA